MAEHIDVVISSTSVDLSAHRQAVYDAIIKAGMYPHAMENGTASGKDAIGFSLDLIDKADVYVGIFGLRYGYVPDDPQRNPDKRSVTELEYRYAIQKQIPIRIFILSKQEISADQLDDNPENVSKLKALKEELTKNYVVAFCDSVEDLRFKTYQSMMELADELKGESAQTHRGAVKIFPTPPTPYIAHPYTLAQDFFGRATELGDLDEWVRSDDPVMIVEAIGGIGKSALTWEWVNHRAETVMPNLAGVVWWSFYDSDGTLPNMVRHAVAYLTGQSLNQIDAIQPAQREAAFLRFLAEHPVLLIFDGFERTLAAYHQMEAPRLNDESAQTAHEARKCTDPREGEFLGKLAACRPSKVLISTRLIPRELEHRQTGKLLPGVRHRHLNGLAPADALALMRHLGVTGSAKAITDYTAKFDHHSLLINILAKRITKHRRAEGDFDVWLRGDGTALRLSDLKEEMAQNRTFILQYALAGLTREHSLLLSRIATFRYPVDYAALMAINPYAPPRPIRSGEIEPYQKSPELKATTEALDAALDELQERSLLQRSGKAYDLHPVVRGYAFEQLTSDDRQATFAQIRDYFSARSPENLDDVKDIHDLRRTLEIYNALVGAGLLDDASDLYGSRLERVLYYQITAYPLIVELLTPLFPEGWDKPPALSTSERQSARMTDLALAFYVQQQIDQALAIHGLNIKFALDRKRASDLNVALANYAGALSQNSQYAAALGAEQLNLELAEASGDANSVAWAHLELFHQYTDIGQWDAAEVEYGAFNAHLPSWNTEIWQADAERYFATMLVYQGMDAGKALDRAGEMTVKSQNAFEQRVVLRLCGQFALEQNRPADALDPLHEAILLAQKSGEPIDRYRGDLARAYVRIGRRDEARQLVEEGAPTICAADVYLELGERDLAREFTLKAYEEAWADGEPYSNWYVLKWARALLAALGIPEPSLPKRTPKPIPYEAEIVAFIEALKAKKGD